MRLIDADMLLEKAWDAETRIGYVQVVDVGDIEETPEIDAVPVVRCSQCQYGQFDDLGVMHCHKYHCHKKENDFCSYGEKREDRHE